MPAAASTGGETVRLGAAGSELFVSRLPVLPHAGHRCHVALDERLDRRSGDAPLGDGFCLFCLCWRFLVRLDGRLVGLGLGLGTVSVVGDACRHHCDLLRFVVVEGVGHEGSDASHDDE